MKAIDTNVLVRFLVGDDKAQAKAVYKLFKNAESTKSELFVTTLVVLELIWVLESAYSIAKNALLDSLEDLLLMPILKFEHAGALRHFLTEARASSCELSGLLIACVANAAGGQTTYTFDKKAAKHKLFELIK